MFLLLARMPHGSDNNAVNATSTKHIQLAHKTARLFPPKVAIPCSFLSRLHSASPHWEIKEKYLIFQINKHADCIA